MPVGSVVTVSEDPLVELFVADTEHARDATLLVIHGGPDWDHTYLYEPLAELTSHRVILPDLRGCGRSTRGLPLEQYHPDAAVRDLLVLLDVLGVERTDVLGFSYGGLLAQRLVLMAPERVRRLVVASSAMLPVPQDAFAGWRERDRRRASSPSAWNDATLSGADLVRAAAVADAQLNVWRPESVSAYRNRIDAIRFGDEWLRAARAGTLAPALPTDAAERLGALQIPVLLLHGRQDMIFPVGLAEDAARQIESADLAVIDEAGHMTHLDQPDDWLAAISQFLGRPAWEA